MYIELCCIVLASILMVLLPRKWVLIPFFLAAILLPSQALMIAGLHFYPVRVLVVVGLLRLLFQTRRMKRLGSIDRMVLYWVLLSTVSYTLLWQSNDAFIYRCGQSLDVLGVLLIVSNYVVDFADIERVIRTFSFISTILCLAMMVEWVTGRNAFSAFGGIPTVSEIREGRVRCQGPFHHAIMAGSFGAVMLPLFISLYRSAPKYRLSALLGVAAATLIVFTSASSGPMVAFIAGIIGLWMWPLRKTMRWIRWASVLGLIFLDLLMKAPVWALIGRVHVFSGSDAYHRAVLIDKFVAHFGEWWLLGTRNTEAWAEGFLIMHDVTNQFVRTAVDGGLLSLILFISVIVLGFRAAGSACKAFRGQNEEKLSWGLGVCLFVNIVSFMGVSYFDQIGTIWYALLGLLSVLSILTTEQLARERRSIASFAWVALPPEAL